jgi:raffinose/stachyose/melibiose transport system permease protein
MLKDGRVNMSSTDYLYIPENKLIKKGTISKIFIYIFLSLWAVASIAPMLWVTMNSFKTSDQILTNALSFPKKLDISSYQALGQYAQINISKSYINSFIISGSVVILVTLLGCMAAFVLGRFKFVLNNTIRTLLIASMLIPQFAVILPNALIFKAIHINGTYLSVIVPHTAGFLKIGRASCRERV